MLRIFDIDIYRDGGSIEFRIERDGVAKHVWLDTPFRGEPRALKIDSRAVAIGAQPAGELAKDVEEW
jgi:hypothetical protein